MNRRDLSGQRFGRLVALSRTDQKDKWGKSFLWTCRCDCGNICTVSTDQLRVRQDNPELRLIAALPYPDCYSRWSVSWRKQYTEVLEAADLVKAISPAYSMASFQKRDEWMVDHASRVIAVYDGMSGGTKNTIVYAKKNGIEVEYV